MTLRAGVVTLDDRAAVDNIDAHARLECTQLDGISAKRLIPANLD